MIMNKEKLSKYVITFKGIEIYGTGVNQNCYLWCLYYVLRIKHGMRRVYQNGHKKGLEKTVKVVKRKDWEK
jgi:hypothetical protein